MIRLLSAPAGISIPANCEGFCFEWTQSRKNLGSLPPMIRLAVCVQLSGNAETDLQGENSKPGAERRREQWFVSAVGDRKCHAYGAALEYFSCTAASSSDASQLQGCSRELRTASLADMLWRPLELHTLHVLKQPAKPQKLPCVELEGGGDTPGKNGSCIVLRVGFWCDAHEPPDEETETHERCRSGSQLHKPSAVRLSGNALVAARAATLQQLLTPAELSEVQALADAAAVDDAGAVLLDLDARPGETRLTKKDRTRLYDAICGLHETLHCSLIDQDGQARVIKISRDDRVTEAVPGSDQPFAVAGDVGSAHAPAKACQVLDAVEFGVLQLVQLTECSNGHFGCPNVAQGGHEKKRRNLLDSVTEIQASATAVRLNALLELFEGKAGHSFHNFSTSLTASQRKCQRQVSRAMCSGSFLVRCNDDEAEGTAYDPIESCWVVLTICSPGFLYRQIQHMIGCGMSTTHLSRAYEYMGLTCVCFCVQYWRWLLGQCRRNTCSTRCTVALATVLEPAVEERSCAHLVHHSELLHW